MLCKNSFVARLLYAFVSCGFILFLNPAGFLFLRVVFAVASWFALSWALFWVWTSGLGSSAWVLSFTGLTFAWFFNNRRLVSHLQALHFPNWFLLPVFLFQNLRRLHARQYEQRAAPSSFRSLCEHCLAHPGLQFELACSVFYNHIQVNRRLFGADFDLYAFFNIPAAHKQHRQSRRRNTCPRCLPPHWRQRRQ